MQAVLVLVVQRVVQPLSHILVVSQWCFVHEWLLVALFVKGSKVRNDYGAILVMSPS